VTERGINRQWLLRRHPVGRLAAGDLQLHQGEIPEPAEGQLLVRVLLVSMDPAIRAFLSPRPGYRPAVAPGMPVTGMVLGEVVESRCPGRLPGELVSGFGSWSDHVAGPGAQFAPVPLDLGHDLAAYTHVLGTSGLTAHHGLTAVGALTPGDTVLVSAAAGAVGSLAGQMARILGARRVVGIAGGPAKCRLAESRYGYDTCIDYRAVADLGQAVRAALPEGADLCFENVGGASLQAALDVLRPAARIVLCGMISQYDAEGPVPGPPNLWNLIVHGARMQGFRIANLLGDRVRTREVLGLIAHWLRDGRLKYDIDLREGFEQIPQAFAALSTGQHHGRLLVRINTPQIDNPSVRSGAFEVRP
jgi:NADPH-dependent curcumin reductase CurA